MDDVASAAAPPTSSTPTLDQPFLLRDLDTGVATYLQPADWPAAPIPSPHPTPPTHTTAALPPPVPSPSSRPPRAPAKRARSDELLPVHRTLRPSDRVRVLAHRKPERDRLFTSLYRWQRVRAHAGPVRALEFCASGRWLATAGADALVKLWDIDVSLDDTRPAVMAASVDGTVAPSSSTTAPARLHSAYMYVRKGTPAQTLRGHTADITALSWSKNDFLLSASADHTIRLWHPRAKNCLRRLVHSDVVTDVAFHPTDEQICIAASADGLVRMWHLKERKLLSTAETDDVVTSCAITPDGTTALVGTRAGRCKFFGLFDEIQAEWQFKHTTQLDVRSRRARHAQGKKICGFRFYSRSDKVLVSSNDNRLRLYRLDDKSVVAKFVGHVNAEARFNGSFDPSGRFVMCASETRAVHIWELDVPLRDFSTGAGAAAATAAGGPSASVSSANPLSSGSVAPGAAPPPPPPPRKDVGVSNESFIVQEVGQITAAVFAPRVVPRDAMNLRAAFTNVRTSGLVIVTASDDGDIRVFGCC